jgi:hypothetical protein
LLAPVLDVYKYCLSHSAPGSTAAAPRIARNTTAMPETPAAGDGANFCDKVLRQTAAEVGCSFAAVVMPSCGVSHYWSSENESDLAMDAAVQSVHAALFKWMAMKRQPTAINRTGGIHSVTARYKIAAAPILDPAGQVLGLMLLFRQSFAANFLPSDLECARAACRSLEKSRAPRIDHVPSMSSASSVAR